MDVDKYLQDVLKGQTLADDGEEMNSLRGRREEVEKLLRKEFDKSNPAIRYAGSFSKGTMIRESYDLDIACYFLSGDIEAGNSLKDIFNNVRKVLAKKYIVEPKNSALRLKGLDGDVHGMDFHIDVVPGRFSGDEQKDVYMHRENDDKVRLKTNPQVHVDHVRDSGVRDAIKMLKYWRERNAVEIKTFVLELLIIDLLKDKKDRRLQTQLSHVWTEFRDHSASLSAKDPANPEGNDLSGFLNESVRNHLSEAAGRSLHQVEADNWESIFGNVASKNASTSAASLSAAIASRASAKTFKPWTDEQAGMA